MYFLILAIVNIIVFAFWFGVGALLTWLLSLIGVFEFNLLYAVIFAIVIEIILTIANAGKKND